MLKVQGEDQRQVDVLVVQQSQVSFFYFKWRYLAVYACMMLAEWLQGPYIYKLYLSYGFTISDISYLFIAGYGGGALLGFIISGVSDSIGRKNVGLVFCIIYALHCIILISKNYLLLMLGRIIAGCATLVLFTVFEAWMVHDFAKNRFEENLLNEMFSYSTIISALTAIFAGIASDILVPIGGLLAPFYLAIFLLVVSFVIISLLWEENYGDRIKNRNLYVSFRKTIIYLHTDFKCQLIGLAQSLFESAMYIFVFVWTPSLIELNPNPPLGLVYSIFMLNMVIGAFLFNYMSNLKIITQITFFLASSALAATAITKNYILKILFFSLFELSVGVYYPAISRLRNIYIPNTIKATVLSLYRVSLNTLVVVLLLLVPHLELDYVLLIASSILLLGGAALTYLPNQIHINTDNEESSPLL